MVQVVQYCTRNDTELNPCAACVVGAKTRNPFPAAAGRTITLLLFRKATPELPIPAVHGMTTVPPDAGTALKAA
jgi:hypothetical protein